MHMGQVFGESYRENIIRFAAARIEKIEALYSASESRKQGKSSAMDALQPIIKWHKKYHPDIWDEFSGICQGANVSPLQLLIATGYTDVQDYLANKLQISHPDYDPGGCTAVVIPAAYSQQGSLLGQTWDMFGDAKQNIVMVKREPDKGLPTLYFTLMGGLGLIGCNSEGVAIGTTNLTTNDHAAGVNYMFTISNAFRAGSMNAAANTITNTTRLAAHNFLLVNEKAGMNIEANCTDSICTNIDNELYVHTNHCLSASINATSQCRPYILTESSQYRYDHMTQLIAAQKELWNMEKCWEILSDNQRSPGGSAISVDYDPDNEQSFETIATILICPKERRIQICPGSTRSGKIQEFII